MHGDHNVYFKLHVNGCINVYRRTQVVYPCFRSGVPNLGYMFPTGGTFACPKGYI